MIAYIVRRILATIPVMLMVAVFVFSLLYLAPGDPAAIIAGEEGSIQDIEQIRQSLNLDQPFLLRFGDWLLQILRGDLGTSIYSGRPIAEQVQQRVETTVSLMVVSMVISVAIAIPLGVLAAWKKDSWIDRGVMIFAVFVFSVPVFVFGYALSWLRTLILPSLAMASAFIGLQARMTRATMLEVLSQDYIRTAKAKGLNQYVVLFQHALKNAAVPITTVVGLGIAGLLSGSVVIETVFALPGLGRLVADAILRRDYPVIQSLTLIFGITYVLVNLIVDLVYTIFDPRVRY